MNLYKELLNDHYKNPRNRGYIADHDFCSTKSNPSCGDSIQFSGNVDEKECIRVIHFQGKGCVISMATASLLTEFVTDKNVQDILLYDHNTITSFIGISLGPVRLKCALLPLHTLQQALSSRKNSH